jgi:hypothetical protein
MLILDARQDKSRNPLQVIRIHGLRYVILQDRIILAVSLVRKVKKQKLADIVIACGVQASHLLWITRRIERTATF